MIEHASHVAASYFDITAEDADRYVTALRGYYAAMQWARTVSGGEAPRLLPSLLLRELSALRTNGEYIENTLILIAADEIAKAQERGTAAPDGQDQVDLPATGDLDRSGTGAG